MKIYNMKKILFAMFAMAVSFTLHAKPLSKPLEWIAADHGIVSDGITLNTQAIQQAIDQLSSKGGGTLRFTPGCYLTGSIEMKSHVELSLDAGATLLGSVRPEDYTPLAVTSQRDGQDRTANVLALILSNKANDIKLTGYGTIDGQGLEWVLYSDSLSLAATEGQPQSTMAGPPGGGQPMNMSSLRNRIRPMNRPTLFCMIASDGILVENLTCKSSAGWGLHFEKSSNIVINGIREENRAMWNNDGIDLTDCQHVRITDCYIDAADDGICLKSEYADNLCDDIYVSDCEIRSSASAVKFGTSSYGGFKNITIRNIRVFDTFRSAIAIESVDGAEIENVTVDGIYARNTGNAIFVRLGQRTPGKRGYLRNITLRNISCEIPFGRPDEKYDIRGPIRDTFINPIPSSVTGLADNQVENVLIENVELLCPGRGTKGMAYVPLDRLDLVPEQERNYPEFNMFGELPSWAFYIRHAKGVTLRGIRLFLLDDDFRPAIVADDAEGLAIEDLSLPIGKQSSEQVFIR